MHYLIVNSHPYSGSFNCAAVKTLSEAAQSKGHAVTVIDLVADGFNPVMTAADLKAWSEWKSADPMVAQYQRQIEQADMLVFPFPVWWGAMPAVLKGFCDKVLLPGWAYKYDEQGQMVGLLTGKKAIVVTTMDTPLDMFKDYFGNPVEGAFIKDTLKMCGVEIARFYQIDQIVSGGRAHAELEMQKIAALID